MRVLILDDEAAGREELRKLLGAHDEVEIVGEAHDVAGALKMTQIQHPNVVFLDVQLRGETAFEYIAKLGKRKPRVVFVTGYERYAVRGFECNAMDYLLKPILPARLHKTLERVRKHILPERLPPKADDSVFLSIGDTAKLVPWQEIDWIQSQGNYTNVAIRGGQNSLMLRTMKQWEEIFPPGVFVRINRSIFIRIQSIAEVRLADPRHRKVLVGEDAGFRVSRNHWPELKEAIIQWHPEAIKCLR